MTRVPNPYYASPLGQTLNNTLDSIAQVALSGPSPWEQAQTQAEIDYKNALTGKTNLESEGLSAAHAAPGSLADVFKRLTPGADGKVTPQAFQAAAPDILTQLFTMDPKGDHIGDNMRAFVGLIPGMDPNYFAQVQGGAGQDYKTTMPGFQQDQAHDISMNNADNATLSANNAADNARAMEIERIIQEGLDKRFTVQTSPGAITTLAPNNPTGQTTITGQPTLDTQRGAALANIAGAGGLADPNEVPPAGSVEARLLGGSNAATGGAPHLVTNDQGIRVEDAPGVHVGLPGGKASTPKNYRTPDNRTGLTTDGITDLQTGDKLPQGSTLVGSAPFALTEAQGKATGLALALDDLINVLQSLPPNFDPTKAVIQVFGNANIPLTNAAIGSKFLDPDQQRYLRAARQALAIILRGDLGAAITAQEFALYAPIYIPQIGDQGPLLNDKWKALNDRRQSFISQSGVGYGQAKQAIAANPAAPTWGGGGSTDTNTLAAEALQAIAAGADEAAVRQRFQEMTGQPLPGLAAPGRQ